MLASQSGLIENRCIDRFWYTVTEIIAAYDETPRVFLSHKNCAQSSPENGETFFWSVQFTLVDSHSARHMAFVEVSKKRSFNVRKTKSFGYFVSFV